MNFSVSVGAYVIELSQISSFFWFYIKTIAFLNGLSNSKHIDIFRIGPKYRNQKFNEYRRHFKMT